jgi:hypothetical protein
MGRDARAVVSARVALASAILASAVTVSAAPVGCTGNDVAPALDASADGASSANDASDDGPSLGDDGGDGGADAEQDPNVYPSKHQAAAQIDDLGGPVIVHPKVVTVTFQGDPMRDAVRAFDDALVTSDFWRRTMTEYGVGDGVSGGVVELPDTVTGTDVLDEDIQALVASKVAAGIFPAPDASTVYVLYYPAKVSLLYNRGAALSCIEFVGYHSTVEVATDGGKIEVPYVPVARCNSGNPVDDAKYVTVAASHALAEAATDPHPQTAPAYRLVTNDAWLIAGGSVQNDEVADLCGILRGFDAGPGPVQRMWSNAAAATSREPCQPSDPNVAYFGAAVRTSLETIGARKSYGYLPVPRGGTTSARVDVFSTRALDHDLTLLTGRARGGDPTRMDLLPQGISATLSRSTAHNGNAAWLTVAAPVGATPGDYPFVVRAVFDATAFVDWPVIAHVK